MMPDPFPLKSVTCRCILAGHPYNDLGFQVGDRLIVLVEAQSSWSPNIVLRLLSYWVQTLNNYFTEKKILLYKAAQVPCPKPELYVIVVGVAPMKLTALGGRIWHAGGWIADSETSRHKQSTRIKTGHKLHSQGCYRVNPKSLLSNRYLAFCRLKQYSRSVQDLGRIGICVFYISVFDPHNR